jgi:murein DD-endopeptidase MepM/ murein hydrolase activator NlpD
MKSNVNPLTLIALAWIAFIALMVFVNTGSEASADAGGQPVPTVQEPTAVPEPPRNPEDPAAIQAPYKKFFLTQGLHGYSYGHQAIDVSAGKGAEILSPISGMVSDYYVDQYGNTTLILDNDVYQVTLMHGNYTVSKGDTVHLGQPIGVEWNNGYTLDFNGNLCAGRDCGYHTHLNIYDKRLGANANPLTLLNIQ